MIIHYLTVAIRNLRKYKSQTLISVIGLAVGFTCFVLAMLWIRYETSFDNFHKNADRIYCLLKPNTFKQTGYNISAPYPLAAYLKETFPEISNAVAFRPGPTGYKVRINDVDYPADFVIVDSSFLKMFDIKIIEGSKEFLIPNSRKIAVTQEKARALFGNESPIGKEIYSNIICAVVTGYSKRSNYPFDFLYPLATENDWYFHDCQILVELSPTVDVEAFRKKLYGHTTRINDATIVPLTSVYYEDPAESRDIKFQHIIIFALAGSLVILCTLFNYLTLFISRFRMRQRELALRTVYGASGRSLLALLSIEFIISLLVAGFFGMLLIYMVYPAFKALSGVKLELSAIYSESLIYIGAIILISLATLLMVLMIFRRRTLNTTIRSDNKKLFRKVSVLVQLIVSIGFAFCTTVIVKQMYSLYNTDLGFAVKNRGAVKAQTGSFTNGVQHKENIDVNVLEHQMKQIAEITETLVAQYPLIPLTYIMTTTITDWEGKSGDVEYMEINNAVISEQYAAYYELQLIEGEMLNENEDINNVLINESAVKTLGLDKPVGKKLDRYTVKGVIKNIYSLAPTVAAKPCIYSRLSTAEKETVLFKFREGTWKACEDKIKEIAKKEYPNIYFTISNAEEKYDEYLKSENALLKLLSFVSLICIIICIFGFVSLVSLTCEERRKEIAIRKINGATVGNILSIFFKEYFLLLVAGAIVAFPVGYHIMQLWLEQYVRQTSIPVWVYVSILSVLVFVIVLCVGWRVYKASVENPAEVIKN